MTLSATAAYDKKNMGFFCFFGRMSDQKSRQAEYSDFYFSVCGGNDGVTENTVESFPFSKRSICIVSVLLVVYSAVVAVFLLMITRKKKTQALFPLRRTKMLSAAGCAWQCEKSIFWGNHITYRFVSYNQNLL